jgi:hypothetical protein
MMAQALIESDKPLANKLVHEAFIMLAGLVDNTQQKNQSPTPQDVALTLLPVVENIDAELVQEYLWRTVSLCDTPRSVTAAGLARYDRTIARQWLAYSGLATKSAPKGLPYHDRRLHARAGTH